MLLLSIILYLLLALVIILLWIMIAPLVIFIDTKKNIYYVALKSIFRLQVLWKDATLKLRIRVFGIPFTLDPVKMVSKSKKEKEDKKDSTKKKKKEKKKSKSLGFLTILRLIRYVWIQFRKLFDVHLRFNFDTGEPHVNGILSGLLCYFNKKNIRININYDNNNSLSLKIKTRGVRFVWAAIKILIYYLRIRNRV